MCDKMSTFTGTCMLLECLYHGHLAEAELYRDDPEEYNRLLCSREIAYKNHMAEMFFEIFGKMDYGSYRLWCYNNNVPFIDHRQFIDRRDYE